MWYAIFAGDDYYHLVKPQTNHTLCGLPTLKREMAGGDYHPPARVLHGAPPAALYRSCPRCMAEDNASKARGSNGV